MKILTLLSVLLIGLLVSCNVTSNKSNPEKWSDDQVSKWFSQRTWLGSTELKVDSSLDKREFAIRYYNNKERWDRAFNFLKNEDLVALKVGNYELDSHKVYVRVTEYYTKDPAKVLFETHRNYSDIQYVTSGTEYIEMASSSDAKLVLPYDKGKDIEFFEVKEYKRFPANPGTCFIIFPNELHRPSIMVDDSVMVKKIVIKVMN